MSTTYIVDNTSGELNIILNPGGLDGPGGLRRSSDLRLYGMGALLWGEGMDENILRLAETFAVESKQLGDFLPGGADGNADYNPATDPILPKDENDLGPGLGITTPLNGQLWFNDSSKSVYVFNKVADIWDSISAAAVGPITPLNPLLGMTWFDTNPNVCGQSELKVYNPTHPDAIDGFIGVAGDYVSSCGDDMSGELNMTVDGGITRHKITNLKTPNNDYDAVNKIYVDSELGGASTSLSTHINDTTVHLIDEQNDFMDTLSDNCMSAIGSGYDMGIDLCHLFGWNSGAGTVYAEVQSKLSKSGGNMTGSIILPSASPTNPYQAVYKDWVEQQITNIPSSASSIPVGSLMLFANSSVQTGWERVTSFDNRFLRVVSSSGGGTGGSHDPRTMDKTPAHTHTGSTASDGNHYHISGITHTPAIPAAYGNTSRTAVKGAKATDLNRDLAANTNTTGSHSHTITMDNNVGASNWLPKYFDVHLARKL